MAENGRTASDRPRPSPMSSQSTKQSVNPTFPPTSFTDNGLSRRPRDARLIHMILANRGVTAYQERVPLQLMDFAYRYTSSTLQDALHFTSENYGGGNVATGGGKGANTANNDLSSITINSLKLSVESRTYQQFNPSLPKDFHQDLAQERNRIALPPVGKDWGVKLPSEKYCLTGVGWGLKDEWESEGETEQGDQAVEDAMDVGEEGIDGEEGDERMEDFFGEELDAAGVKKDVEDG